MVLREDAVPVVKPTRRVPYALRKPLKKELDRMCAANIIEKVEEPSDWYVPGSKLVVADTLSSIPAQEHPGKGTTDVEIHAVGVLTSSVGPATLSRLQAATASDETLQDVILRLQSSIPVEVSSPHFPRSNGLAEKGVQVVKRILDKMERSKEDFYLGLLNYRVCPLEDGRSPAELLMGRSLRTLLPEFSVSPPRPATHDRPPAGTSGLPNSDDFYRRSTRPQRPPPRLAYTHGFQQSETA
ncbi:uncharacterized protein LOC119381897 [Rhipicephalus sanguineus]|uniref:uncharacterized protein LOC119381897 n=1 Tax=Rhipicephalus sanguineus TaxID=34632 RepID=UPI0020C4BE6A|nr:uncharacterized protein LOC119381897 [Rhipicephalus sanguineus]